VVSGACFPKANRLLRKRDFDQVFDRRCSAAAGPVVIYAARNELGWPRLGLVVSRKVGSSVARSRWKRRLREAFRLEKHALPQDLDLVIIPRQTDPAEVSELREWIVKTARRLRKKL
jgi:ribonuclease P protein component